MSGKDTLRELVSFDPHFLIRCHQLIQAGAPYINGLKKKHTLKSRVAHLNSLILVEDDHSQGILLNQRPPKGIRIRLCKGAYKEPEDIAFQKKSEVDASYVKLMKLLMKSGVYHGLATHDETIIKEATAFATRENIPPKAFEFQMLHGIRRDLQQGLVKQGWGVRVYIPFGTEWYPYFMRRVAERPANVLFIAKNILRR